jgi:hypothetical protein
VGPDDAGQTVPVGDAQRRDTEQGSVREQFFAG